MGKTFTEAQVRDMLRLRCHEAGGMRAWGREHNFSGTFVSNVLSGRCNPTDALARELGLVRVVLWEVDNAREVA